MRHLYLLRGNIGSGKSYWIEKNGFGPYTLCADDIRLQLQSPVLTIDGTYAIGAQSDRKVWQLLFDMLETRMERGELVFIDATHSRASDFANYKKLAHTYRYRIYCIDFSDIPLETCKLQNISRSEYKRVRESALDNIDSRLKSQPVPSYVQIVKPVDYMGVYDYAPLEFSNYKAIHILGDIHGCYEPLKTFLNTVGYHDDHYYIFIGDYVDRGIQNVEVVKWLIDNYNKPNILLLEGNHERWLRFWAEDELFKIRSNEFLFQTKPELDSAGLDKGEVRQLCRKFAQVAYIRYNDSIVLVNHGGISKLPRDLVTVATEQFIKGVGKYEDMLEVAESWFKNSPDNAIQVSGHRNVTNAPIEVNSKYYNLQGDIEFGGNLRVLSITSEGIKTLEIPNTTFRPKNIKVETTLGPSTFVKELRENKYIIERKFGDISSFNFNRKAFYDKVWNGMTTKARGLFINTVTNEIVARSYNKFFNLNEREETKAGIIQFKYPVDAYIKYNGFLGLVGYDTASDQLLFTSKGTLEGTYPSLFKGIWAQTCPHVDLESLKKDLKERNISLVFEVIDIKNDPHIVEYGNSYIVLLDIVRRTLNYEKFPYEEVKKFADKYLLLDKTLYHRIESREDFVQFYQTQCNDKNIETEGFVLEDSDGFMVKIKLPYYNFWKHMRMVKDAVFAGKSINLATLTTPEANYFYAWLKMQSRETLAKDIITLRNIFKKEKKR